jgi:hypothetical protein
VSQPEVKKKRFNQYKAGLVVHKLPRSQGVVMHHIIAAFVYGSLNHRRRVETYGAINRTILNGIGKPHNQDGTTVEAAKCKKRRTKSTS